MGRSVLVVSVCMLLVLVHVTMVCGVLPTKLLYFDGIVGERGVTWAWVAYSWCGVSQCGVVLNFVFS